MRAIVSTAPQQVALVEDWAEPACGPDDVVVSMRAVGLCGSDLSIYDGSRLPPTLPWIMGHEGGGTVVAVGSRVADCRVGQRVVIEPNYPCRQCPSCQSGATSNCTRRRVLGMTDPGILAERVAVPASYAWPVPETWPDELLACFEPLAVARAAVRRSGVRPGADCLVVGAGSQGLFVCLTLLGLGAQPYVTDPHEGRVAFAEKLGATRADLRGDTYPQVFETAGPPAAFATALRSAAHGGTISLIGLTTQPVQLLTAEIIRRGLTIIGSIIYDHPDDFADTRAAMLSGGMAPERALSAGVPASHADVAFTEARSAIGKSWIDLTRW